jgi:hypothetical protein
MSLRLDIDSSDFDIKFATLNQNLNEFLPELVFQTSQIITDELRKTVPVKTGKFRASIRNDVYPEYAEISTNTDYGLFVDQDTEPHWIRAVNAKFLRFVIDGKTFFRKKVWHTGTTGQQFHLKTIKRSVPRIEEMMEVEAKDLMNL